MSDVATQEPDSIAHKRMQLKIKRDEKELEDLLKGVTGEAEPEEVKEEVQAESKDEPKQESVDTKSESEETPKEEIEPEPKTQEEKTFKKRYGDIRRHLATKEQEYESKIAELKKQLNSAANNELVLPKTSEEIDAWTKKFPEVASIVESIADRKASEKSDNLDKRIKEFEVLREEATREKEEAALALLHPDYMSIREGEEFHTWAEEQPKWVQDVLYDQIDHKSVARVIDLYKADKGIKTTKPKSVDKAAASSVKTRSRQTPEAEESNSYLKESVVEKMTAKEYAEKADEIMEAIRSGKFVYDLKK